MSKDYRQIEWDAALEDDCRQLIRLAVREDLDRLYDWTTVSLVPEGVDAEAAIVARESGVLAGLPTARLILEEYDAALALTVETADGDALEPGRRVGVVRGPARSLLAVERPLLNLLGRMSGVASLTACYVTAVAGTSCRVFDTRKTLPGWRRLDKYAVRVGGGRNHRMGLYDGVLIKDNHLAYVASAADGGLAPGDALEQARQFVREMSGDAVCEQMMFEVEVDTLDQLRELLPHNPDVVLLDNMSNDELRAAVSLRNAEAVDVSLEASGGVRLNTVAEIAATGVDRVSVGELTHSARWLDLGLDWVGRA